MSSLDSQRSIYFGVEMGEKWLQTFIRGFSVQNSAYIPTHTVF
jgi:hypothetical protein